MAVTAQNPAGSHEDTHKAYGTLPWPVLTPALRDLIGDGRVFALQQTMRPQMPQWPVQPAYKLTNVMSHEDSEASVRRPVTGSFERIEHAGHSGTHIDALCHIGCWRGDDAYLHGNAAVRPLATEHGFAELGAEHFPPIVARGVLLDLAALKGVERLPDVYTVTADDLRACEERQGVLIEPGSVVLLRTGFESLWAADPMHFIMYGPGPGVEAARYMAERGCIAAGGDTANFEVTAFPDLPVHLYLLYERGIPIIENLRLSELAAAGVYEFLFVAAPIAFAGSTGASIAPLAIA